MKRTLVFCMVMVLAMFFASASEARRMRGPHGPVDEMGGCVDKRVLKNLEKLDLSDVQKHDIAVILKRHREELKNVSDRLREARMQLGKEVRADEFNADAIRAAFRQMAEHGEQMVLLRAGMLHEIKGVLTPEQVDALRSKKKDVTERGRKRMDRGFSAIDRWIDTYGK